MRELMTNLKKDNDTLMNTNQSKADKLIHPMLATPHYKQQDESIYLYHLVDTKQLPEEGWKIHLSTSIVQIYEFYQFILPLLEQKKVNFKLIGRKRDAELMESKSYPRYQCGKFIVIYPSTARQCTDLLKWLYEKIPAKFSGIDIMNDFRYRDSKCIFCRFGGIAIKPFINEENDRFYALHDADGNLVSDRHEAAPAVPLGVMKLPDLYEVHPVNYVSKIDSLYEFTQALKVTNVGGVFLGHNKKSNQPVILKQAKAHRLETFDHISENEVTLRKREAGILQELTSLPEVPTLLLDENLGEEYYFVEQFVPGETLKDFARTSPMFDPTSSCRKIVRWEDALLSIIQKITRLTQAIADRGFLVGDISAENFKITEQGDLYIIDLEGAIRTGSNELMLNTSGFCLPGSPAWKNLAFGVAMLAYYCISGKNNELQIDAESFEKHAYFLKERRDPSLNKILALIRQLLSVETEEDFKNVLNSPKGCLAYKPQAFSLLPNVEEFELSLLTKPDKLCNSGEAYVENKSSWMYGTMGTLTSIKELNMLLNLDLPSGGLDISDAITGQIVSQLKAHRMNAGLIGGAAGILLGPSKYLSGKITKELMSKIDLAVHSSNNYGLWNGLSGIGLTLLIRKAPEFKEFIKQYVKRVDSWQTDEIGLAYGKSGAALFLTQCYLNDPKPVYKNLAINLMRRELKNIPVQDGALLVSNRMNGHTYYPYLAVGAAGVVKVLTFMLRYLNIDLPDSCGISWDTLAKSITVNTTVFYGLNFGAAGIIDAIRTFPYQTLTKNESDALKESEQQLLRMIHCHAVFTKQGFQGFPSDQLTQLATDRGSGTSGILLELAALNKGVVDEIIPEFYSKGLLTQAMKYTPLEVYHAVNV